jgi:transposase InsO family protein
VDRPDYLRFRELLLRHLLSSPLNLQNRIRFWYSFQGAGQHHSDRGIQYASKDYTDLLKKHRIAISMSRKGNPYDNATCESFMKTLKYEEVYRQEYRDLAEALASIGGFIERVYNERRLHSALGYCPPAEFERMLAIPTTKVYGRTYLT